MNYLIDTHSHIYAEEFDADRDEAIRRAREAGVERLLLPAIDSESHGRLFDTVRRYPDHCTPMMGLHPTSINDNPRWREELALVERYLCSPPEGVGRFCAVGEIGLDYYWDDRFKAEQLEAFTKQCRLAATYDLPVAIHTRAAWKDMCRTVETETKAAREKGLRLRGVFHAFAEDADTYRQLKECGDFLFGIGGVVTFKKSRLADTVREMELDDLVLETDCPYLTPVPYRGQRNESGYIPYICNKIAALKGMKALLTEYNGKEEKTFEDILDFHVKFEQIHPFQDGNGRVGRLIMFKECLKYNIVPFIIEDNLKMFYYRGLKEWNNEKGYLTDTCLTAQDKYKAYLDYFRIVY